MPLHCYLQNNCDVKEIIDFSSHTYLVRFVNVWLPRNVYFRVCVSSLITFLFKFDFLVLCCTVLQLILVNVFISYCFMLVFSLCSVILSISFSSEFLFLYLPVSASTFSRSSSITRRQACKYSKAFTSFFFFFAITS